MTIYIYGNESFKKDIHEVLTHSNIKFRLDGNGQIIDLKSLNELKNAIEDNPNNIYLIDDSKIIKKNSLNEKIKFLKPKDGIEQEYLLDHGIGDISVDSFDELSKHLIKRLEASIGEQDDDSDIQNSIVEIVEDAYGNELNQLNEEGSTDYQLDEELSSLLSNDSVEEESSDDDIAMLVSEVPEEEVIEQLDSEQKELTEDNSLDSLKDLDFDEDFDNINIEENKEDNKDNIEKIQMEQETVQGDEMVDEFSEIDNLNENDILEALDDLDSTKIESNFDVPKVSTQNQTQATKEAMEVNSSSVNDIANLISKLLNNKTLEITIKVKD